MQLQNNHITLETRELAKPGAQRVEAASARPGAQTGKACANAISGGTSTTDTAGRANRNQVEIHGVYGQVRGNG